MSLEKLKSWSEACWILLTKDIPALLAMDGRKLPATDHTGKNQKVVGDLNMTKNCSQ